MNLLSKPLLATGLASLLFLTGCASSDTSGENSETNVSQEQVTENGESGTNDSAASSDNDIDTRAKACEEVLSDAAADQTSSEYKGCKLETEIPKVAEFLYTEDGSVIFHIVKDNAGIVTQIVSFKDSNGNKAYDAEEQIGSYEVDSSIMKIEVVKDTNSDIEGEQVTELSSMLFVIPS